jgi:hypothetical protein
MLFWNLFAQTAAIVALSMAVGALISRRARSRRDPD